MRQSGFTLLEILLALLVFAILATIAAMGLHVILKAQTITKQHAQRLEQVQMAVSLMSQDLQQAARRSIVDNTGSLSPPLLLKTHPNYLELTRGGYVNPLQWIKRSTLLRVAYELHQGQLVRQIWPVLDRVPHSHPQSHVLLKGVRDLTLQVLDSHKKWLSHWPISPKTTHKLPRAVQFHFCVVKWGCLTRLIVLDNGEPHASA